MNYIILTSHVMPPIPTKACDWCAYVDGEEERGPYGWGRTERDAIADLRDRLDEDEHPALVAVNARLQQGG